MSHYMFMATDYTMPDVINQKIRRYRFKEGVKKDIDENGKWYFYTNEENKNSTDLLIPCSIYEKADIINVDSEEDFHELQIFESKNTGEAKNYTDRKYIYNINFSYSERRSQELVNYLRRNIRKDSEVEIWSIWLGDKKELEKYQTDIKYLSKEDIMEVYYNRPRCLMVRDS